LFIGAVLVLFQYPAHIVHSLGICLVEMISTTVPDLCILFVHCGCFE